MTYGHRIDGRDAMLEPYTPAVERALTAAAELARREGSAKAKPLHLLLGLLQEEEGRAAQLLGGAGLAPAEARRALTEIGPSPLEAVEVPPESTSTQQVMAAARELAEELSGERTIATEHLLLAALRADVGIRCCLVRCGLAYARLEASVLATQAPPLRLDEPLHLFETTEQLDTARILDAAANRAREALRVVEDYCRFVLDDAFLSGELKRLRHELASALGELPAAWLLTARDTLGDVGTAISTPQESQRQSLTAVVEANLKRLQEALRSLEEYGKVSSASLGRAVEALRYRAYTLERALALGAEVRARLADVRLYVLVSGASCAHSLEWTIREAAAGGAQAFQLREKGLDDRSLLERARQVRRWTRDAGVLFIMNDRPDLARLAEADGVHVGQDELPVKEVRRIVGPEALIGVSTHDLTQLRRAVLDGASYVGVGPTFPSATKEFAGFPGLELVRAAVAETSLPAFAIGGINVANLREVVTAGARRVAVSGAICQAEDPRAAAVAMRQMLDAH
jgi:thiamine-phosphate pyrophosphorylase